MKISTEFRDSKKFCVTRAILIYSMTNSDQHLAATIHDVKIDNKGRGTIQEGKALNVRSLKEMANRIDDNEPKRPGLWRVNDPRIIASAPDKVIWLRQSGPAPLHWRTVHNPQLDAMDGKQVLLPTLVFFASGRHLRVFAVKTQERPRLDCELFLLPFFNVSHQGDVCMPTPANPRITEDNIQSWEDTFFDSPFSHAGTANPTEKYWIDTITAGRVDEESLDKLYLTIGDLLK